MVFDANFSFRETCAITREPLGKHIVCDEVGTLFNKESVLQKLLDRTLHENPAYSHIRLRVRSLVFVLRFSLLILHSVVRI